MLNNEIFQHYGTIYLQNFKYEQEINKNYAKTKNMKERKTKQKTCTFLILIY